MPGTSTTSSYDYTTRSGSSFSADRETTLNSLKGGYKMDSQYQRKSPLLDNAGYQRHSPGSRSPLLDDNFKSSYGRSSTDDRSRSLLDSQRNKMNLEDSHRRTLGSSSRTEDIFKARSSGDKNAYKDRSSPVDAYRKKSSAAEDAQYKKAGANDSYGKYRSPTLDNYRTSPSSAVDSRKGTLGADDSYSSKRRSFGMDDSYDKRRSALMVDSPRGRTSAYDDLNKGRSSVLDEKYGSHSSKGDSKSKAHSSLYDDSYKSRSSAYDDSFKGRSSAYDDAHKRQSSAYDNDSYKSRSSGYDDSYKSRSSGYDDSRKTHSPDVTDGYTSRLDKNKRGYDYDDSSKSRSYSEERNRYSTSRGTADRSGTRSGYRRGYEEQRHFDEDTEEDGFSSRGMQYRGKTGPKKKRKNAVTANLSGTRYDVVRQMVEMTGMTVSKDEDPNCYLIWNDSFVSTDKITEMKSYQKINHFPGMGEVCRKDCLARNMAKMAKVHLEDYCFVPRTWIFPSEYGQFQNYAKDMKKKKKNRTFIVKPANGAMGNGISLFRNAEKIPQNELTIVQEYLEKPLLVEGFKCDLRIYVLVTSCDPLRVFLFNDGLLRLSTEKYIHPTDNNVDHLYMHLTNYSVNKHSENYDKSGTVDTGSKRTLKFLNEYLRRHDYDVAFLWRNITDLIIKTLIVAQPHVLHAYRMCRPGQPPGSDSVCFEILGFDVMLDKKLRPWLLEINRSPSFGTDEKLDYDIKSGVVEDTLRLLNIRASDKRKNMAAQKAQAQKRLMRPTKRVESEASELEKKRQSVEKKKEELKDLLTRMRKDASREDFENRHCGRFKRIFPPDDKFLREKYANLMNDAFGVFSSGRTGSLQQEIQRTYNNKLREEDVLDMLAQCEVDEKEGRVITSAKAPRGPKYQKACLKLTHLQKPLTAGSSRCDRAYDGPLQSMPTLSREKSDDENSDEEEDTGIREDGSPAPHRKGRYHNVQSRINSNVRPVGQRSKSLTRPQVPNNQLYTEEIQTAVSQRDRDEEMTKRTLLALNDMRIKFPGKSDEEADYMLDRLHENWKYHKPRVASYWLVKLDSIKRRKVIDIVRSNVRAVLQRMWKSADIETLRLNRVFCRVFNRLLWSHGQGLWNCFQTSGNSWETIFSKSTDSITATEMACCRRIVQLCRDCLLIVYQFAVDAKGGPSVTSESDYSPRTSRGDLSISNQLMNHRGSRLYQKRSSSLNNLYGAS